MEMQSSSRGPPTRLGSYCNPAIIFFLIGPISPITFRLLVRKTPSRIPCPVRTNFSASGNSESRPYSNGKVLGRALPRAWWTATHQDSRAHLREDLCATPGARNVSTSTNGLAEINWQSIRGKTYTVKYSDDLLNWTALGNSVPGTAVMARLYALSPQAHLSGRVLVSTAARLRNSQPGITAG